MVCSTCDGEGKRCFQIFSYLDCIASAYLRNKTHDGYGIFICKQRPSKKIKKWSADVTI